jgi:hypothetical protein
MKSTHSKSKSASARRRARAPVQFGQSSTSAVAARGGSVALLRNPTSWGLVMPERFRTKLRVQGITNLTPSSAATDSNAIELLFQGNGLVACGPATNYPLGTQTAAALTYPSGLRYLLGSDGAAGAPTGLYANYLVHSSAIEVELVPLTSTKPLQVVLWPADQTAVNTMPTVQCAEQPFAVRGSLPPTITAAVPVFRNAIQTKQILGLASLGTENISYTGVYNSNPAGGSAWFWLLRMNNLDGSTSTYNVIVRFSITYDVEFFDLNSLSTSAPT